MNKWQIDVLHFMQWVKGLTIPQEPTKPSEQVRTLCMKLVEEETNELYHAMWADDLVEVADGIVDSIYVLLYTANAYGMDIEPIWREVQRTNLAKRGGPFNEAGKQLKPEGWKPPVIEFVRMPEAIAYESNTPVAWIDSDGKIWQIKDVLHNTVLEPEDSNDNVTTTRERPS